MPEKGVLIIAVIGPYFKPSYAAIDRNINLARQVARMVWSAPGGGLGTFTAHLNTAHFEMLTRIDETAYQAFDKAMISRACDCALLVPGWQRSKGTLGEIALFNQLDRPVFEEMSTLLAWRDEIVSGKKRVDCRQLVRTATYIGGKNYWITVFRDISRHPLTEKDLLEYEPPR